jgi:integration host factor subunit alpha
MYLKNLTRKDLTKKINKNLGFSKNFSSKIVDDFIESLISELIKYKKIKITSFGTFNILNKKERVGRNPKTKQESKISARKVVIFKPSLKAKKKLNTS